MTKVINTRQLQEYKKKYNRIYHLKNKDEIIEKQSQKVDCDCGRDYSIWHKSRHVKSTYHRENTKS